MFYSEQDAVSVSCFFCFRLYSYHNNKTLDNELLTENGQH